MLHLERTILTDGGDLLVPKEGPWAQKETTEEMDVVPQGDHHNAGHHLEDHLQGDGKDQGDLDHHQEDHHDAMVAQGEIALLEDLHTEDLHVDHLLDNQTLANDLAPLIIVVTMKVKSGSRLVSFWLFL